MPIVQLGLVGQGLTEEDLYDMGLSFIRPRLANVKGAAVPLPYGGKVRQVQVDIDPNLMYAQASIGDGCLDCDQSAEPDSARGHCAHGRPRVYRQD